MTLDPRTPRIHPAGDAALVVEVGESISPQVRDHVRSWNRAIAETGVPGLVETVPSYCSVLVVFDPLVTDFDALTPVLSALRPPRGAGGSGRVVEVPVRYGGAEGPDLAGVAQRLGLSEDEVVALHSGAEYPVYMLGFMPGFAYLGGLPDRLRIPRLSTPRARVPRGSVALAGEQTGVYPLETPGGWHLIGRTPVSLWNPQSEDPFLIGPNAVVRFVPIGAGEYARLDRAREDEETAAAADRAPAGGTGGPAAALATVQVLEPGLFTTVQDLGRSGFGAFGLTTSGAADAFAHRVANRLVGNADGRATLEVTAAGPRLRFLRGAEFAVTGAEFELSLDGEPVPGRTVIRAEEGQELRFGRLGRGFRAYLALAGGVDVPPVMGSRSTLHRAGLGGFGGRPLRRGDVLSAGAVAAWAGSDGPAPLGTAPREWFGYLDECVVRVVPGPQDYLFAGLEPLFAGEYRVKPDSDRMGVRLDGPVLQAPGGHDIISDGIALGSVQVPADGHPIVMLADHHTAGGYPKPATVITGDLRVLAQKKPGEKARFAAVGAGEGARVRREQESLFGPVDASVLRWSGRGKSFVASVRKLDDR